MAQYNRDWDDLGRSIEDIVDRAINSHDYQKLNQTIRQVVDRVVDAGSEAVRKAMDGTPYTTPGPASTSQHNMKRPAAIEKKALPALYANANGKTAVGIVKIVGGSVLSFFMLISLISISVMNLLTAGTGFVGAIPVGLSLTGLGAGGWLIGGGINGLGRVNRFKTYRKVLGEKTHCTLEKLARSVGKSVKYVRKELRSMIDEGLFLQGHLDREESCLITSDETYRYYEQSRLQLEQRQRLEAAAKAQKPAVTHTPQVQEVLDRGNAFIAQIRKCNDEIPGQEISAKISRMETIVQRIFERVKSHPEIVSDLKKLMDYYLPMTVKLLQAYADMDAQPVQGENILSSKREIEGTLDTLNQAFEKLLDDLFMDTAMDVSSDISVLNTLLAQEGLTGDDFSKMKQQKL